MKNIAKERLDTLKGLMMPLMRLPISAFPPSEKKKVVSVSFWMAVLVASSGNTKKR